MITIRGLAKTYADGTEALKPLDLDLGDGLFGLLGPNGAGKTTFLSLLVLALEPTRGSCLYHGLDPAQPSNRRAIRRLIGYLPQHFVPIAHLTGLEYLVHVAGLRGLGLARAAIHRRARECLARVDLVHAADRRAGGYSGGMKRRLGIAQAILHEPRLLIVDEPTAGLDPEERIRFRNLMSDVAETTSVLLSTHIVEDVEATCPRLGIIARGQLLYDGEPGVLMRAADGRLWELGAGHAIPDSGVVVGRRLSADGRPIAVIHAETAPAHSHRHEPRLEEAYAAFLALRGEIESGVVA